MKRLRCAIYTRKSSEEGLDQSFNSLDAQHEACEAYIVSQKSEGWAALGARYDDGGWSGGNMERPGLRRLLADIEACRIDIVVVYKVDRLTRSLADFAKMVELFDRHGASFVSVTQAFNTTSSMGRLTLNVLLSFAQFEREVTGERIRDKIAASKARGMWMGGYPPLGYDPKDRALVMNEQEATIVRRMFERYLSLGSVNGVVVELERDGVMSKCWTSSAGRTRGGNPYSRGAVYHLLRNRLYLGEIVHKDRSYPGQHPAIVDSALFAAVQAKMDGNRTSRRGVKVRRSPLAGLIYDAEGYRMTPAHARGHRGQRYCYYVSAPLQEGRALAGDHLRRVPGVIIEEAVIERMRRWFRQPCLGWDEVRAMLTRIEIYDDTIILELSKTLERDPPLRAGEQCLVGDHGFVRISCPVRLLTRGGRTWLVQSAGLRRPQPDRALIAGLRRAHRELRDRGIDLADASLPVQSARGVEDPYLRKLVRLAFLAPDIQHAILEGRHPPGITLAGLMREPMPSCWEAQRTALGFSPAV